MKREAEEPLHELEEEVLQMKNGKDKQNDD